MTEEALLLAVRDHLRNVLPGCEAGQCDVELDGTPPPIVGEFYLAVSPGDWQGGDERELVLAEKLGVDVHVFHRGSKFPRDRQRNLLLQNLTGINARCRAVIVAVHMNYDVMAAANELIEGDGDKLYHPLAFQSATRPQPVNGSRFFAKSPDAWAGIERVVRFTGAERMQGTEDAT